MKRYVFFSFCYDDVKNFRVNVVRNSWVLTNDEKTFIDGSIWEKAKTKGEKEIKRVINIGLRNTSATVVLIGAETYSRRWVKYEVVRSFEKGNALIAVHINRIRNKNGNIESRGINPFDRLGIKINENCTKISFYELKNRKWIQFNDLKEIRNNQSNSRYFRNGWIFSDCNKFYKFSELFKTYCWQNDNGRQ